MPKYIDADALKQHFTGAKCPLYSDTAVKNIIDLQPSADVREDTHGHWIEDDYAFNHCSECGYELEHAEEKVPFCPWCGADMVKAGNTPGGTRMRAKWQSVEGRMRCSRCSHSPGSRPGVESLYWLSRFCPACGATMTNAGVDSEPEGIDGKMTRAEILDAAKRIVTGDREDQYGKPEDCFEAIAALWAGYLQACGVQLDFLEAHDVAAMMALLKIARIATGGSKEDSWIDLAGYAACGGELQTGGAHEQE